jgi:hypothetical protein
LGPRAGRWLEKTGTVVSDRHKEEAVVPDVTSIVTGCLEAWTSGDFDTALSLIDDDISFAGRPPTKADQNSRHF